MIDSKKFNDLPTFFDATTARKESDTEVRRIGDLIESYGQVGVFGCFLLHKHFDLQSNEKIVRFMHDDSCLSTPVANPPSDLVPIAWCANPESDTGICALEFSMVSENGQDKIALQILNEIRSLGLAEDYGIYRLDCVPKASGMLFETSDEALRISVVSKWNDMTHEENQYIQSTYSFSHINKGGNLGIDTNTGILCSNTQGCQGCAPSSPLLQSVALTKVRDVQSASHEDEIMWAQGFLRQFDVAGEALVTQ